MWLYQVNRAGLLHGVNWFLHEFLHQCDEILRFVLNLIYRINPKDRQLHQIIVYIYKNASIFHFSTLQDVKNVKLDSVLHTCFALQL